MHHRGLNLPITLRPYGKHDWKEARNILGPLQQLIWPYTITYPKKYIYGPIPLGQQGDVFHPMTEVLNTTWLQNFAREEDDLWKYVVKVKHGNIISIGGERKALILMKWAAENLF